MIILPNRNYVEYRSTKVQVHYCSLCLKERTNSLPFGNISLFNKSHSIDGFPGPVNNKLIDTAINNKSKS
jgi:hypothetical protein